MNPNTFNLGRLREGITPFRLHWYPCLSSTNIHAGSMRAKGNLFAPAMVLAGRQTRGRGRGENTWWSDGGSLTVTFVLPVEDRIAPHQLPLMAGLAVRQAAAELTGDNTVGLKWPNDLLHNGRKVAGLLCERLDHVDLIGLGLNVNTDTASAPPALLERITSLQMIMGRPLDLTAVLIAVARQIRFTLSYAVDRPFAQLLREYDSHHALVGQTITVAGDASQPAIAGTVVGMDDMGRLLVRSGGKVHAIIAGQINGGY